MRSRGMWSYLLAVVLSLACGLTTLQLPPEFKLPFLIAFAGCGVMLYFVPDRDEPTGKPPAAAA